MCYNFLKMLDSTELLVVLNRVASFDKKLCELTVDSVISSFPIYQLGRKSWSYPFVFGLELKSP